MKQQALSEATSRAEDAESCLDGTRTDVEALVARSKQLEDRTHEMDRCTPICARPKLRAFYCFLVYSALCAQTLRFRTKWRS